MKKRFNRMIALILIILSIYAVYDFVKYPEVYLTTWKYQLQQDIKNGDAEAIEYYTTTYVANGKVLFDEQ